MSVNTYTKYHDRVCSGSEKTCLGQMENAAKEEAELAVQRGDVDENGIPILTVVADGHW